MPPTESAKTMEDRLAEVLRVWLHKSYWLRDPRELSEALDEHDRDRSESAYEHDPKLECEHHIAWSRSCSKCTEAGLPTVFEQYLELSIQHIGVNDEKEEDRLAELMDPLWRQLTEGQRAFVRKYGLALVNMSAPICGRCGKPRSAACGDDFVPIGSVPPGAGVDEMRKIVHILTNDNLDDEKRMVDTLAVAERFLATPPAQPATPQEGRLRQSVRAIADAIESGFPESRRKTCGSLAFDKLHDTVKELRFAADATEYLSAPSPSAERAPGET